MLHQVILPTTLGLFIWKPETPRKIQKSRRVGMFIVEITLHLYMDNRVPRRGKGEISFATGMKISP
jgi:hypothetical protein